MIVDWWIATLIRRMETRLPSPWGKILASTLIIGISLLLLYVLFGVATGSSSN